MYNFSFGRQYYLRSVLNVEQNPDPKQGSRFLLELELGLYGSNKSFRLSEYVYLPHGTEELCFPEGIEWFSNATVYFILPVKNQGKWVRHFASQLANMTSQLGDFNFHVVIVDFASEDINIDEVFSVWPLQERYTLIKLTGPFYKTLGLTRAVEAVPNHHDIVFLFDLHIDVPIGLLDSIRKVRKREVLLTFYFYFTITIKDLLSPQQGGRHVQKFTLIRFIFLIIEASQSVLIHEIPLKHTKLYQI